MIFGKLPTSSAVGAVLAHTTRLKKLVLPKGTVLLPAHVDALLDEGHFYVVAAQLEPGDVPEDEAAQALGSALAAPGLSLRLPGTGRANIVAEHAGFFQVSAAQVDAINMVHDSLTLGTLPDAAAVARGEMVATIKIIPFSAPADALQAAITHARANPPLRLAPFRPLVAGLVLSALPGLKPSVLEGTVEATQARIARLTGRLLPPITCNHAQEAIAEALRGLLAQGADILLVAGASAVVDREDEAPSAIVAAGGRILHFGMPVDPGNLLCLGAIGGVPAIVLPGCARSPKLNGIDFILARIFAGEPAGADEIRRMGTGGLLKEFAARPSPRKGRKNVLF